jgi:anaerobic selenocysteine-containing dehydrogenase
MSKVLSQKQSSDARLRSIDRIADPWGPRTPVARGERWPARIDSYVSPGAEPEAWFQTASVLHSDGDAYDIGVQDGRIVGVRGREADRVNRGRLGPKDLFGWQANHSQERLTTPLVRRDGELAPAPWDEAMETIVQRSRALLQEKGPGAIGFYTSGQLFLEEYYTLAVIARAGMGTNHLDGNTRLCTATAGEALKESFGCDGQPGSYEDIHHAETIVLFGHNVAETQPVLWMRILDRLEGPDPPQLVVVDPRRTLPAQRSTLHLPLRSGTNLALLNALLRELIANGWVDDGYVAAHAVGFDELREQVAGCTPEWAAEICGLDAALIREAARLIGQSKALFCTVLQGVYQSHQATAAACQINNLVILRGMLGRRGCGVLQMNGQPTAQNTRETGANGDLTGFRNWQNDDHVADLARIWNVDPLQIPHYAPPTHVMEMVHYMEQGVLPFMWVSATNPLVSLPEAARIRSVFASDQVFLVVQDLFMTETAAVADVVLPAATWGEKTGTFTNADRTVHLSLKAVEAPGEARSDLEILLDYARRMDFRDKDGEPLVKWSDPESAFEAFRESVKDRPCSYDGITYDALRDGSGIQWGGERLYADGRFFAAADECETFGRDLLTGASIEQTEYRALNPEGKAILRACEYVPSHETPDEQQLHLDTGRTIFHFHTRTKTARAPQLQRAAPDVWAELSEADARRLGLGEGDLAEIRSARGAIRARVRVGGVREGVVFVPFHYGWWDSGDAKRSRAANELTITDWDPVSKQPLFKIGAVRIERIEPADGRVAPAPTNTASAPVTPLPSQTAGGEDAEAVSELP